MKNAEWLKIKEIFNQTLDLPESEREEFLNSCNESVRIEVLQLLNSHYEAENFIVEPAVVEFGFNDDQFIGKTIGEYQILQEIGAGGMGKVYLAMREGFEQKFALKLIKRGMDTDAVLKSFVRERQILSRLEHPNIARLLNVGSTKEGLPYFVMEFVDGEPITKYCENKELEVEDRLEMFQKVCSAVGYAHQNLVVHRDLKPSNILVTAEGTPKLLDFGIAKLLDKESFEAATTGIPTRMFTPEYASPEQINGLPITTATDVYSLGVVLYELLSGSHPFKATGKSYREIADLIITQEPLRPSSVVSGQWQLVKNTNENKIDTKIDKYPRSKNSNLKFLKGDLDNIILKALRKEPERRYQNVQEFSEDIRRFLKGLPVSATANSVSYRFSKFVGRHKFGTLAAGLMLLLTGFSIWQAVIANNERAKSEKRFEQVRKLANTVLFEYHDGISALPGATGMREKMVKDSLEFLDNLSAESIDNIELKMDIARAYKKVGDIQSDSNIGNIGKTQEALQSYQKAYSILETIVEKESGNVENQIFLGNLHVDLGGVLRNIGDLNTAEFHFLKSHEIFSNLPESTKKQSLLAKSFWNLASLQTANNDWKGTLENYEKAVQIYERLSSEEPQNKNHLRNIALTNKNIGSVLQRLGQSENAVLHFQKSLQIDSENAKNNPNDVLAQMDLSFTFGSLASVLRDLKNFEEAESNYLKAIEIRESVYNADNKNVVAENALARGYQELGRTKLNRQKFTEAEKDISKAQIIYQKISASDPENVSKKINLADSLGLLGFISGNINKMNVSEEYFNRSLSIFSELLEKGKLSPINHRNYISVLLDFAETLIARKQNSKAIEQLNLANEILKDERFRNDSQNEIKRLEKLQEKAKEK